MLDLAIISGMTKTAAGWPGVETKEAAPISQIQRPAQNYSRFNNAQRHQPTMASSPSYSPRGHAEQTHQKAWPSQTTEVGTPHGSTGSAPITAADRMAGVTMAGGLAADKAKDAVNYAGIRGKDMALDAAVKTKELAGKGIDKATELAKGTGMQAVDMGSQAVDMVKGTGKAIGSAASAVKNKLTPTPTYLNPNPGPTINPHDPGFNAGHIAGAGAAIGGIGGLLTKKDDEDALGAAAQGALVGGGIGYGGGRIAAGHMQNKNRLATA